MDETIKTISAFALPVLGAVIWLIRLEGRVNTHAVLHTQLKEDVTYIRDRIDRALNGRGV